MQLSDAINFAKSNASWVVLDGKLADVWSCVDGRIGEVGRFAGPGGALGILCAVVASVQLYEKKYGPLKITFDHLVEMVEGVLGGMACHTDSYAASDDHIAAGCSHCNGIITMADEYGVGKYVHHIKAYIDKLKSRNVYPEMLSGEHGEQAVIVIAKSDDNQPVLTLPGTDKHGRQAFICHLGNWLSVVSRLTFGVVKKLAGENVNKVEIDKCVAIAAKRQLQVTLRRLAKGLPVYLVFGDNVNNIQGERLAEDAAKITL